MKKSWSLGRLNFNVVKVSNPKEKGKKLDRSSSLTIAKTNGKCSNVSATYVACNTPFGVFYPVYEL